MIRFELTAEEAALLGEILEAQAKGMMHELHHTTDRTFRESLRDRLTRVEGLLGRVRVPAS